MDQRLGALTACTLYGWYRNIAYLKPLSGGSLKEHSIIGSNVMHAFIIEDEYLIGQSVRDMLEKLGFTSFSFARSEDAAVMGATEQKIDLITADVRLLPGDGVNAVEAICKKRAIPVVFITGYAEELQDRAPTAVVVQKPIKESELAAAVRNVLREKRE